MEGGEKMLGRKILELRKEAGLTQEELGKIVGVGRTTINAYEKDIICPPPEKLVKMADKFNTTTDYMLGRSLTKDGQKNEFLKNDLNIHLHTAIDVLFSNRQLFYNGQEIDNKTKQIIIAELNSLENILNILFEEK